MAITANAIVVVRPPVEGDEVVRSVYSADLSGAEDVVAAVAGKFLYIRKIQVFTQADANATITFGSAQTTGVTTIYLGPLSLRDAGGNFTIDFGPDHAMKIARSTSFSVDTSLATPTAIVVWYKVAD
jgi:hypothetical protein